jgi:hypothetical protein
MSALSYTSHVSTMEAIYYARLTYLVNTLHVLHRAKPTVALHPVGLIHERLRLVHECGDAVATALRSVVVILACPFCDPDGQVERRMHVGYVGNEVRCVYIVVICVWSVRAS